MLIPFSLAGVAFTIVFIILFLLQTLLLCELVFSRRYERLAYATANRVVIGKLQLQLLLLLSSKL